MTVKLVIAGVDFPQVVIVVVHDIIVGLADHHNSDGGAMVGSTLQMGQALQLTTTSILLSLSIKVR